MFCPPFLMFCYFPLGGVTTQPGKNPSPYLNSMHAATTRPASARPVSTGRPRHMPAATQVRLLRENMTVVVLRTQHHQPHTKCCNIPTHPVTVMGASQ
jgi:hypothetical protein